jgi:cyclopropane-fatty-acyl-phospholipid synthase
MSRTSLISRSRLLGPLFDILLGNDSPARIELWDGSHIGSASAPSIVRFNSPLALRRILYMPNELGFGRAYVAGDLDIEGDVIGLLRHLGRLGETVTLTGAEPLQLLKATAGVIAAGAVGRPLPPPKTESNLQGALHAPERDRAAISYHYDLEADFYRLLLGPTMTYSCAFFASHNVSLEEAQAAKHRRIAMKLGLAPGMRLLDVGCGFGEMAIQAASNFGVEVVGVTLSETQYERGRQRVKEVGLEDRIELRLEDYREVAGGGTYDAISSIGMFEHVGKERLEEYFTTLFRLLKPGGRLLNHAISSPGGGHYGRYSFLNRYVFPDGELQDLAVTVGGMEQAGLEVRDVETLREHYPLTLRSWLANLEGQFDQAVELVGAERARIWRLYMSGAVSSFEANRISVHQTLAVKTPASGDAGLPLVRPV